MVVLMSVCLPQIGKRCRIAPFTVIGEDVEIGDDTVVGSNATLVNCTVGQNVVLHAGVRIGQDGFGFQLASSGDHAKKPQELRVEIHDHVEIGYAFVWICRSLARMDIV